MSHRPPLRRRRALPPPAVGSASAATRVPRRRPRPRRCAAATRPVAPRRTTVGTPDRWGSARRGAFPPPSLRPPRRRPTGGGGGGGVGDGAAVAAATAAAGGGARAVSSERPRRRDGRRSRVWGGQVGREPTPAAPPGGPRDRGAAPRVGLACRPPPPQPNRTWPADGAVADEAGTRTHAAAAAAAAPPTFQWPSGLLERRRAASSVRPSSLPPSPVAPCEWARRRPNRNAGIPGRRSGYPPHRVHDTAAPPCRTIRATGVVPDEKGRRQEAPMPLCSHTPRGARWRRAPATPPPLQGLVGRALPSSLSATRPVTRGAMDEGKRNKTRRVTPNVTTRVVRRKKNTLHSPHRLSRHRFHHRP